MARGPIDPQIIAEANAAVCDAVRRDYAALGEKLARRGTDVDLLKSKAAAFSVALPSWGVGTGGTRFARFPMEGEPRSIFEKIEDCGVVQQLTRITPRVSPHFPWDIVEDCTGLREHAAAFGLTFDAVNSNTFQDQKDQPYSYKFGSLTHTDPATRRQAIDHNLACIDIGQKLGSTALTVWIGDGSNFPGQQDFTDALDRYLESMQEIYAALPEDWCVFIEHKMFEPAFYSTVIQDWGTGVLCAQALGEKALCLVDLGHHAPNVNIEMIVARLHRFGKLGGFHFNDSKYGDDDLDSGSVNPFQLFLVFNELVAAEARDEHFNPAYMLDQSHNVTDPLESLMTSAEAVARAYVKALLVDRAALKAHQEANDALMAHNALRAAYETDVTPILALARHEAGGAIDPIAVYRAANYRAGKAKERPQTVTGSGGIV